MKSKTKALTSYIREAQYADAMALLSNDDKALQLLLTAYNSQSKRIVLQNNMNKTETMSAKEQVDFHIDGPRLKRVNRYKYSSSLVTMDCKLDEEITARIQAA